MSMKEIDAKLNALRRENFDLKLRLFYEKQGKGGRKPEAESFIAKEFERYEKTLEEYKRSLTAKDRQITVLTNRLEGKDTDTDQDFEFSESTIEDEGDSGTKSIASGIDQEIQTVLGYDDLERINNYYQISRNKNVNNSFTQTGNGVKMLNVSSQASQTTAHLPIEQGIQTDEEKRPEQCGKTVQTKPQVSSQAILTHENGPGISKEQRKMSHDRASRNNSSRTKGHQNNVIKEPSQPEIVTTPQSLYTYKAILTPMTKSLFKNPNQLDRQFEKKPSEIKPKILFSPEIDHSGIKSVPDDDYKAAIKQRYSTIDQHESDKASLVANKDDVNDHTPYESSLRSPSHTTNKVYDIVDSQMKDYRARRASCYHRTYSSDMASANVFINSLEETEKCHLSSPDLGIEDSDQDVNSSIRAYVSLGYYQLLRGNLNQIASYLNCLDNLYRDCFILQSINQQEYSNEVKPSLSNLHQMVNSSRLICKYFTIEDENSLFAQFERVKAKKENMEKAITRQLKKTDKLLKKAKINLKES